MMMMMMAMTKQKTWEDEEDTDDDDDDDDAAVAAAADGGGAGAGYDVDELVDEQGKRKVWSFMCAAYRSIEHLRYDHRCGHRLHYRDCRFHYRAHRQGRL